MRTLGILLASILTFTGLAAAGCVSDPMDEEEIGVIDSELVVPLGRFQSIRSFNFNAYLRHRNFLGELTTVTSSLDRADATFQIVPGLADGNCISFRSSNFPDYYLRHQNFRIKLDRFANDTLYRDDATFCVKPSLAGVGDPWVSFESYNFPGFYLRHADFHFYISNQGGPFREDATFKFINPL
jgi:Alpha-L-arabinofuranosidase B (ABFB) domain